jgi:uncharacterized protein (TIGR00369 family)
MSPFARLKNLARPSGLRTVWSTLRGFPGGGVIMGRLVGRLAPYSGTIRPEVLQLEHGFAKVRMADRPALRNHLRSVHAIALINLAEATSGLAMMFTLPDDARGIPNRLEIDYLKKARGPMIAQCTCPALSGNEKKNYVVEIDIKNESGEVVARAKAMWVVGPA